MAVPESARIRVAHLDSAVDPAVAQTVCRASTDRHGALLVRARRGTAGHHGTITAAILNESAPSADVYSIEVVPGGEVLARVVTGLRWAGSIRPHVVCLALGFAAENRVLDGLVGELCDRGTLVVAAIGNDGAGEARQPALHPQVLAVGASDASGRATSESGSVFAPASGSVKPDVLAISTRGTSGACAQVAGAAAELWSRHRGATAGDVRAALVETARPLIGAQRHRAANGSIDLRSADEWLRSVDFGRPLPSRPAWVPGAAWVDPRLARRLTHSPPDRLVRAVLLGRTTDVVEMTPRDLAATLDDPALRVASASDVGVWTLNTAARPVTPCSTPRTSTCIEIDIDLLPGSWTRIHARWLDQYDSSV